MRFSKFAAVALAALALFLLVGWSSCVPPTAPSQEVTFFQDGSVRPSPLPAGVTTEASVPWQLKNGWTRQIVYAEPSNFSIFADGGEVQREGTTHWLTWK